MKRIIILCLIAMMTLSGCGVKGGGKKANVMTQAATVPQEMIPTEEENTSKEPTTITKEVSLLVKKVHRDCISNKEWKIEYTYDGAGNILTYYSESGNRRMKYEYNDKGLLIKEITCNKWWEPELWEVYAYDSNGKLIREENYNSKGLSSTLTYTYDENGELSQKEYKATGQYADNAYYREEYEISESYYHMEKYDIDGELVDEEIKYYFAYYDDKYLITSEYKQDEYKYEYTYDDNGLLIIKIDNHSMNKVYPYTKYEYDSQNRIVKETNYLGTEIKDWYVYIYDDESQTVTINKMNHMNDGVTEYMEAQTIKRYDDKIMSETYYLMDESLANSKEYEYDSNGNIIKYTYDDGSERNKKIEMYEYDLKGNLLKITTYNGNNKIIETEELEYDYKTIAVYE